MGGDGGSARNCREGTMQIGNVKQTILSPRGSVLPTEPRNEGLRESSFLKVLNELSRKWANIEQRSEAQLQKIPEGARSFVELQIAVDRLHLRTILLAKAGETLSGTIRQVQQMGNS